MVLQVNKCPNFGAKIEFAEDGKPVLCAYCGLQVMEAQTPVDLVKNNIIPPYPNQISDPETLQRKIWMLWAAIWCIVQTALGMFGGLFMELDKSGTGVFCWLIGLGFFFAAPLMLAGKKPERVSGSKLVTGLKLYGIYFLTGFIGLIIIVMCVI